jgi:photosystem II stability/assembly factor-like uncharacterized protein
MRKNLTLLALLLLPPASVGCRAGTSGIVVAAPEEEHDFFSRREAAPANARRDALAQIERWHTANDAATVPSHLWKSIGPLPVHARDIDENGRVTAIVVSPVDRNVVVVGTSGGGIWRSTDGGVTFAPVSDDQADLPVGVIAVAPSQPDILYAGMGDDHLGSGVLKSTDGGATWHALTSPDLPARNVTNRIVIDPNDASVLWIAFSRSLDANFTSASAMLMKSVDGGVTFQPAFTGIASDLLIVSPDGKTLLAGAVRMSRPGTGGVYRSTDGGQTWTLVYAQGEPEVPPRYYLAKAGDTLYALAVDSVNDFTRRDILASTDGGLTWTKRSGAPLDDRPLYLAANPHDGTLYLGGISLYRSTDGGRTWTTLKGLHLDHHGIAFDPVDAHRVWFGSDGGLYVSDDAGNTMQPLSDRIPAVEFYSVHAHPTKPDVLFAGAQDNGMEKRVQGKEWLEFIGGDGAHAVFDPANSRMLVSLQGTIISRINEDGTGGQFITTAQTFGNDHMSFIAPMARATDGTVWFATYRMWASHDFGTSWAPPAGDLDLTAGDGDELKAFAAGESDPHTLYTGSESGRVMVTHDAGVTWTDVTPAATRQISSIAIDRSAPNHAYVAFAAYGGPHVLETTDFGGSWSDSSAGLPSVPVNAIQIDARRPDTLYAGTDVGVFLSTNGGAGWAPFDNGMPHVIVTSFTTTADGRLIAGTYGRGAYELVESEPPPGGPRRRSVRH